MDFSRKRSTLQPSALEWSESAQKALLFGATWQPIVTSGGRDDALKMARKLKATHYLYRSLVAAFARVEVAKDEPSQSYILASLIFADKVGGTPGGIALLRLSSERLWLCQVTGQRVVADEILDGDELVALDRVRTIKEKEPQLDFFTDLEDHGIEAFAFSIDLLGQDAIDASTTQMLAPLGKAGVTFPKPVIYCVILALLGVVGKHGWDYYKAQKAKKAKAAAASLEVSSEDAWTAAINNWQATTAAADGSAWHSLFLSIGQAPVKWDGWVLEKISCNAALNPTAKQKVWSCVASYTADALAVSNAKIAESAPKVLQQGWVVDFTALKRFNVRWTSIDQMTAFDLSAIPAKRQHQLSTSSSIQHLLPALVQAGDLNWAPLSIPAPKNKDGVEFPLDPRISQLSQSPFTLRGPTRTILTVLDKKLPVDWRNFEITYASQVKPNIVNSSFSALAMGVVYAKQ